MSPLCNAFNNEPENENLYCTVACIKKISLYYPRMMNQDRISAALTGWQGILGSARVLVGEACIPYSRCTMASPRRIPAVLCPQNETQVSEIVRIAARHGVPLYPISRGNNWGYGTANPVIDDCVIVDLSSMSNIVMMDEELGMVTLQPGVTTQQLSDYITQRNLPFLVPVTGAGPDCSLVGNALERGHGLTPHTDHFMAVQGLRAVLSDGTVYQSALAEILGTQAGHLHKWGIGPYLDGIFTQGNFGIVTEMTIALARRPEQTGILLFALNQEKLEDCVAAVRQLVNSFPGMIGGINLMNRLRMLAMMEGQKNIPPWTGFATIYTTRAMWPVLRRQIHGILKPCCGQISFFTRERTHLLQQTAKLIPGASGRQLRLRLSKLSELQDLVNGKPINTALRLAYKRSGTPSADGKYNPAHDGCGLIWYSPLIPMKGPSVREYVAMIEAICPHYGIEPMITLMTFSGHCLNSTLPILFDRNVERERAMECYNALLTAGKERGFFPYRLNIDAMSTLVEEKQSVFWQLVKTLKQAADPQGIIAPGRYSPIGPTIAAS